jgi:hypothetical protein
MKKARRMRRRLSAYDLAQQCREEATYTLSDLCMLLGVSTQTMEERLAVAKLVDKHPLLFTQRRSLLEGEGMVLYGLAPEWREALLEPEERGRPDQNWILKVVEQHIGDPSDLYRRSIDPDTGNLTLSFHFPEIARQRYNGALETASEEAGVTIAIAQHAHQGELARVGRELLPQRLIAHGLPSLYPDQHTIHFVCNGQILPEEISEAQERFHETTGWHLRITEVTAAALPAPSVPMPESNLLRRASAPMPQHQVIQLAQKLLSNLPGYHRVGVDIASTTLLVRFHFPAIAQQRYADLFRQLEEETAWQVRMHPSVHQEALTALARRLLPPGLMSNGAPSLYHDQCVVCVHCQGNTTIEAVREAEQQFVAETGWQLELIVPSLMAEESLRQVPQGEAIAQASAMFSSQYNLYRIGTDAVRKVLWLHFHFPDRAKERCAEQIAQLEAQTGWRVSVHPNMHQKALIELAHSLLPEGVSVVGKTVVHQDGRYVRLSCEGHLSTEVCETMKQRFLEETGWSLYIVSTSEEETNDTSAHPERMEKVKALVQVREMLQDAEGLLHIAADVANSIIQMKFTFPDAATQYYEEQFAQLERQTGWRMEVLPEVNEDALRTEVRTVLPIGRAQIEAISLFPEEKRVLVSYRGQIKASILAAAQAIFAEKTGWNLMAQLV